MNVGAAQSIESRKKKYTKNVVYFTIHDLLIVFSTLLFAIIASFIMWGNYTVRITIDSSNQMLHSFINGLYLFFSCLFDLLLSVSLSVSERYQNTDDFIACQYLMQFKWKYSSQEIWRMRRIRVTVFYINSFKSNSKANKFSSNFNKYGNRYC